MEKERVQGHPGGLCAAGRMLAIGLCCLLPLLALGCASGAAVVKADDPLFGTWINEE